MTSERPASSGRHGGDNSSMVPPSLSPSTADASPILSPQRIWEATTTTTEGLAARRLQTATAG
uniref:Uncharacterized protein n=1 Tax=Oryza nivara TaxID=4536 RepID=A0A0E0J8T3_ORYNI